MTSVGTVESGTLDWVKTEIDQNLSQAREAISDFASGKNDLTPLRIYVNHLHQVVGTLQMVELDGAAMLAREAECLADVMIQNGAGCDADRATSLLDSSLLDLSSYLENLQKGMSDVPVRNLALMNELRQARGEAPLEVFSIFSPDLEVYPPRPLKPEKLSTEQYKERVAGIRRKFQSLLLQWLRHVNKDDLRAIADLTEQLQNIARFNSVAQLWWVARAHLAVLADEPSQSDAVQKHIPARLDQMLRRLIEGGEAALAKERDENLIKQMLYDIGHSKSKQDLVLEIQRAFSLNEMLSGEAELDDQQLIPQSLRGELETELRSVKDQVTDYFEGGQRDADQLRRITNDLKSIAAFVQHKGPPGLTELISEIGDTLQLTGTKAEGIDEHAIALQVAESLLFLEELLKQDNESAADWLNSLNKKVKALSSLRRISADSVDIAELKSANFTAANVKSLLPAVANEIYVNLQSAEEALESFSKKPEQTFVLEPVPKNLAQVQGTLQMIGQYKAADMLATAGDYVQKLIKHEMEPSHPLVDSLAVAVVTAQSFVEGLENDRPYSNEIVERAIQDLEDVLTERELADFDAQGTLAALNESLEAWLADNANYNAFKALRRALKDISAVASVRNQPKPRHIAREMNNLLDIITEDPSFFSKEIGQTLRRSLRTLQELVPDKSVLSGTEAKVSEPGHVVEQAEVQPEILEIFREEAEECADNIGQLFAVWRNDTTNESVLTDLRRQFHTLKGSGRTANVGPFAELAWIVENLLNQVLDKKLDCSEELLSLIADANLAITELLRDSGFGAAYFDLEPWQARAQELLAAGEDEGRAVEDSAAKVEALRPRQVERGAAADALGLEEKYSEVPPGSVLDDTVVRIFTQETLGHIAVIRKFIREKSTSASAELLRAVHTLRGSSRSLHLVEMSNVFLALDEHLNEMQTRGVLLDQSELDLLDKAAVLSAKVLDRLNADRTFPATLRGEFDGLGQAISNASVQSVSSHDNITVLGELMSATERKAETREAPAATNDETVVADEGAFDLKDIFCEESIDVLTRINSALEQWREDGDANKFIPKIKRDLHTLKGSAFAAGFDAIGDLSHQTETLLEKNEKGLSIGKTDLQTLLEEAHDTLSEMVSQVDQGRPISAANELLQRVCQMVSPQDAVHGPPSPSSGDIVQAIEEIEKEEGAAVNEADLISPLPTAVSAGLSMELDEDDKRAESARNVLRVNSDVLDKLVNYAGEVSITRAQLQEQLGALKANLGELGNNVMRFTDQLKRLDLQADSQIRSRARRHMELDGASDNSEFDPLEFDRYTELQQLSRSLSESLDDLVAIQTEISQFVHRSESVLRQQAQLSAELQDGLMSTRLVPFSTLTPRLRHQVRQTARELGKEADLRITGGGVEIDRKVLDGMSEALEHMIRNALYHGIEDPAQREAEGKLRAGSIVIDCKQQGNEAVIRFSDDGTGLDVDEIRTKAIGSGLVRDRETLSDQEIIQLIVLPGFTTTAEVTQLSGRGVGMDVVHNAVRRLGGSISVESEPGKGATFIISLPLSLSITQAIFVRCGVQEFAVPLNAIQNVLKVDTEELESMSTQGQALFERDGKVYPLINLAKRLHLSEQTEPEQEDRVPLLIVRMGAREVAVRVSRLLATQEVVVKSLGSHIAHLDGIAGATIRGDGTVVLILDLAEIWLADEREGVTDSAALVKVQNLPVVMVVDDSLTVRKVTARNLSRHGMEVVMAKDGLDALEQINKRLPDLMLVDIEMPRMDGYELTQHVRSNAATKHIPIVIITSRAGAKHKDKAIALGANGYLTKPYQEDELVAHVEAFLSHSNAS